MVALLLSIAALAVSLATLGLFLYKKKPAVHSYWPCHRCGRPVAIHDKQDAQGHMECALCKARNR
jgi:hypothetical protein